VIAHRGASGYLPEHTLAAKALAFAMGADYLEQDVVASRDNELVVLHDIHLDRVSNVAERYPDRARADRRFYARDFDLEELLTLSIWERFDADGNAVYPGRFPTRTGDFRLHSLRDELEFVRALNDSTGASVGIYPEIKRPAWHRDEGFDITPAMLGLLDEFGYRDKSDNAFLQCFDAAEVRRIRRDLGSKLRLVQLLGENEWGESNTDYESLRTMQGLQAVATVADGIGPWLEQCYRLMPDGPVAGSLIADAHRVGLQVHPYTVRADSLQDGFANIGALLDFCRDSLNVDGIFTDFPDLALRKYGAAVAADPPD
jgi:glycerophosphoryl diester phosphodiesterase